MVLVRYIVTAPFRAVWFLLTLPFLVVLWVLALLKGGVLAIAGIPVYYVGRLRDRAAIAWDWTRERSRARLSLLWWGLTCSVKEQRRLEKKGQRDYSCGSTRHSHLRKRSSRTSPPHQTHPKHPTRLPPPPNSDSESLSDACVTAENRFSDDKVYTSQYHSPPEEVSDLATTTTSSVEEMSERHRSFSGGVLALEQESPECTRTPSTHGSAAGSEGELLNKALSQLDSETSGYQADAKEVEYIEQRAARISESSHSISPSPVPDSTPTTPNTVVWKKGTCDEGSSTPDPKTTEKKAEDKEEREEETEKEGEGDREGEIVDKPLPQVTINTATTTTSSVEERQRLVSEWHHSFNGDILSPMQESPEYAHTPSTHGSAAGSADELEKDLNKALDSETSGLQANTKEVEYSKQQVFRISESSHSGSPSPFPDSTPTAPDIIVWKKGMCDEDSSTPDPKMTEKKAEDKQEREEEREKEGEEDGEGERTDKPLPEVHTATNTGSVEERQREASEWHRSFSGGVPSPVQESSEYAHTPSTHGSVAGFADDLENDLNKALSHLNSEISELHTDKQEIEKEREKEGEGDREGERVDKLLPDQVINNTATTTGDKGLQSSQVFEVLERLTYHEVIEDTAALVSALQGNVPLQREFISVLSKPNTNLIKLSSELHALQEKLLSQSGEGESEISSPQLLHYLSTSSSNTLDQVKALTIATEAFRELSLTSIERILKLTTEEKHSLFILFKTIPVVSSAHGFLNPAMPESDPVYHQLLTRIGFTDWRGHLLYEKQTGDSGVDKVTLAIIAIHSVTNTSRSLPT